MNCSRPGLTICSVGGGGQNLGNPTHPTMVTREGGFQGKSKSRANMVTQGKPGIPLEGGQESS